MDSPFPVGEQALGSLADKSSRGWFVAETLPRKEQVARGNLERQAFKSFCPCFRKLRRHARKQDVVLAPLFPGYIFVSFDKLVDGWHAINGTRGVKRLICAARGEPQAMPEPVMEALFARCHGEEVERVLPEVSAGQAVRMLSGPFADRIAHVHRLDDKGRVRVLLDILGGSTSVTVLRSQLGLA